jgi:hypothetical protein
MATKTAYLLLVHDQPALTKKIIDSIACDNNFVFIHVDKKSDEALFKTALKDHPFQQQIFFISNRVHCSWGRFSLVEATLNLLRTAVKTQQFHHFILISGRDYLIKPADAINHFLQKNKDVDFLEYYELPDKRLCERQDGIYRINRFHYHTNTERHKEFPPYSKKPILKPLFNAAAKVYHSTVRKMPLNMKVYAGSQWWILSSETVNKVLELLHQNKSIEKFFKNVWIPDEIFFQTIILHIKNNKQGIVNNNLRHISWQVEDKSKFIHIPTVLTADNFNELQASDAFFARKFDENISKELMTKIDKEIFHQQAI